MKNRKALIVDDDPSTTEILRNTLDDAQFPYSVASCDQTARRKFAADGYSVVFLRATGPQITGLELCREFRQAIPAVDLPILVMLRDEELVKGADFLIAGANDLLIGFFEPRELRMRAGIIPADQLTRVDKAHTTGEASGPQFFAPLFDPRELRFTFGINESCVENWESDPEARRISLDKMIVCPECQAVPTFRPGCGSCGSAWVEKEVLIHHYACAHVAPEAEFRVGQNFVCPKCRLADLVAGSDFEQIQGCLKCSDCDAIFTETRMIGHCLSCQHRFESKDGIVTSVYGYEVGRASEGTIIPAPNFQVSDVAVTQV